MSESVSLFDQKALDLYKSAVNQIDDLFEYRYKYMSREEIKDYVISTINQITEGLKSLK